MTDRTQEDDKPGGSVSTAHDYHPLSLADASRNHTVHQQTINIQQVNANNLAIGQGQFRTSDTNCTNAVTVTNPYTAVDAAAASPSSGQGQQSRQDPIEDGKIALISAINRISWEKTSCNVTDEFNQIQLVERQFQVQPQMKIIKGYYRGGYERCQKLKEETEAQKVPRRKKNIVNKYYERCEELEEETEEYKFPRQIKKTVNKYYNRCKKQEEEAEKYRFPGRTKKMKDEHQLQREKGFTASRDDEKGTDITIESLLNSFQKSADEHEVRKAPVTAIVGSAGSGKTTLLRRIARKIMENNELTRKNNFFPSSKSQFNSVHYVELKSKLCRDELTPAEFLFGGCFDDASKENDAYNHLRKYESKQILFFDGLDQATFDITEENAQKIQPFQKADAGTIMYNILSGSLLPHIKIVFTTREFKLSTLPGNAQPREIIALTGFKYEDAKNLFITLVGSEGQEHWKKIDKFSKRLLNLISIPVFLNLTAIVTAKDPEKPPPKTVTELFNRIMSGLCQSDNVLERHQIDEVMSKLKVMAHKGMKEGRVVFTEKDLEEVGLRMSDVRDIVMKVPGNITLTRNFVEGQLLLFFCHQSIQEFLSASFIAEMTASTFKSFCKTYFKQNRWSVVQSFICGIVFQATPDSMHHVSERERKQKILSKIIRKNIGSSEGFQLIELLSATFEANDENLIRSCAARIDLRHTPLTRDAAHLFSTFLGGYKKYDLVDLSNCQIDDSLMTIMGENLNGMNVRIKWLSLEGNDFSNVGLNCFLKSISVDQLIIDSQQDCESESPYLSNVEMMSLDGNDFTRSGNKFEFHYHNEFNDLFHRHNELHDLFRYYNEFHDLRGSFELEPRKLVVTNNVDERLSFETFVTILKFLRPSSIELPYDPARPKQYLTWNVMIELIKLTQEIGRKFQIERVLLDCVHRADGAIHVDTPSIKSFVCYFNVRTLDLVVDDETIFTKEDAFILIQSELTQLNCKSKVHLQVRVHSDRNLLEVIPTIQKNQVENLRLLIGFVDLVSRKSIVSVIEQCKPKTLVLLYSEKDRFSYSEKQRVSETADRFGTKLEFRCRSERHERHENATVGRLKDNLTLDCGSNCTYQELETVIFQESKIVQVDQSGKKIEVGGCFVTFKPGTFTKPQFVTITAKIDFKMMSHSNEEVISPTLEIDAKNLKKPAKIELHTWCMDDELGETPIINIRHFTKSTRKCNIIHKCPLPQSKFIEFECQNFSDIFATLEGIFLGLYAIEPNVYISDHKFAIALLLDDDVVRRGLRQKMSYYFQKNFQIVPFPVKKCKKHDAVATVLDVSDAKQGFEFKRTTEFKHCMNDVITCGPSFTYNSLRSVCSNEQELSLSFQIRKNDEKILDESFDYTWKPTDPISRKLFRETIPPRSGISPITINADKIMIDCNQDNSTGKHQSQTIGNQVTNGARYVNASKNSDLHVMKTTSDPKMHCRDVCSSLDSEEETSELYGEVPHIKHHLSNRECSRLYKSNFCERSEVENSSTMEFEEGASALGTEV